MKKKEKKIEKAEKEIKEADKYVRKARIEIKQAEKTTEKAQDEVIGAAVISKGKKKQNLTSAARDLEKAVHSAIESCEATEEAEIKVKESKK